MKITEIKSTWVSVSDINILQCSSDQYSAYLLWKIISATCSESMLNFVLCVNKNLQFSDDQTGLFFLDLALNLKTNSI